LSKPREFVLSERVLIAGSPLVLSLYLLSSDLRVGVVLGRNAASFPWSGSGRSSSPELGG